MVTTVTNRFRYHVIIRPVAQGHNKGHKNSCHAPYPVPEIKGHNFFEIPVTRHDRVPDKSMPAFH